MIWREQIGLAVLTTKRKVTECICASRVRLDTSPGHVISIAKIGSGPEVGLWEISPDRYLETRFSEVKDRIPSSTAKP